MQLLKLANSCETIQATHIAEQLKKIPGLEMVLTMVDDKTEVSALQTKTGLIF
jgi:hypothetical protein